MIHSSDSEELFYNGYRTEFYAHNAFQIMVAKGFEFLLPPEINPRLIQAARDQGFDESMAQLVAHLGITWEEIFEKGAIDFYLLKTNLIRYITDGTIYLQMSFITCLLRNERSISSMCLIWYRKIRIYAFSLLMMNASPTQNIFSRCLFITTSASFF